MINTRTNNDSLNLLIVGAAASIVGYIVYRWFGADFILGNGPLLIGSALLVLALRIRSWWPAAFLLIQVPFQGLLIYEFGLIGNALTLVAVGAFVSRQSPQMLPQMLLGTQTQRLAALYVLAVAISLIFAEHDFRTLVLLLQTVTLLFIVATVAGGFRGGSRVATLGWAILGATTVSYALSEIEFYFGSGFVPGPAVTEGIFGMVASGEDPTEIGVRLRGFGRTFGVNRLAFVGILPVMMAVGLVMVRQRKGYGIILILSATFVLLFGILLTGSRAGTVGLIVAISAVLLFSRSRSRIPSLVTFALGLSLLVALAVQVIPTGQTSYHRLIQAGSIAEQSSYGSDSGTSIDQQRLDLWQFGVEVFQKNPVTGVGLKGFGQAAIESGKWAKGWDPHSTYVQVLSETGLVGAISFGALLVHVVRVLTRRREGLPRSIETWRTVFLAAFLGMLVYAIFGTAHFARFFWIPIAFAAFLESTERKRGLSVNEVSAKDEELARTGTGRT